MCYANLYYKITCGSSQNQRTKVAPYKFNRHVHTKSIKKSSTFLHVSDLQDIVTRHYTKCMHFHQQIRQQRTQAELQIGMSLQIACHLRWWHHPANWLAPRRCTASWMWCAMTWVFLSLTAFAASYRPVDALGRNGHIS
jgi:hypothetical protein